MRPPVLVALAALFLPASASAHVLVSDGARRAVLLESPTSLRVIDDATSRTRHVRLRACPRGTSRTLIGAAAGRVAYICDGDPNPPTYLAGLGTGHSTPIGVVRGLQSSAARRGAMAKLVAIGSQWAAVDVLSYHEDDRWLLNWRTGAARKDDPRAPQDAWPDLAAPGLYVRLCEPVRRTPTFDDTGFRPGTRETLAVGEYVVSYRSDEGTATLQHCGDGATSQLDAATNSLSAASGIVSWATHQDVHALFGDGRRIDLPARGPVGDVAHTARRLWWTEQQAERTVLRSAPLPAARR